MTEVEIEAFDLNQQLRHTRPPLNHNIKNLLANNAYPTAHAFYLGSCSATGESLREYVVESLLSSFAWRMIGGGPAPNGQCLDSSTLQMSESFIDSFVFVAYCLLLTSTLTIEISSLPRQ